MPDHEKRNPREVEKMFSAVAGNYDKINRAMCFGLDVLWRARLAKTALRGLQTRPPRAADLACGSGDVAIALARRCAAARITGVDFCAEMLEAARRKTGAAGLSGRIEFLRADCLSLPFADAEFDAATISFGFRNFQDRRACLAEIARVLKPSGRLAILEVSRASGVFAWAQKFFMLRVVPRVAGMLGGDAESYRYLGASTLAYPRPEEVEAMFAQAGFENIQTKKMGFGLVAITSGTKRAHGR